jgi:type VII secretion integral membrane protein EccD
MQSAADLCRLTVVTPNTMVELAVPASAPIADFLPAVLSFGGPDLADRGLAHDGWVLQRVGGAALSESGTLDELGVLDGETLYLRPRREQVPEAVFDDLVDGLASAVREREDRLREIAARWTGPVAGGVVLTAALLAAASAGASAVRAVAAGVAAVLLLAGSAVAARMLGAAPMAAMLGLAGIGYAATGAAFGASLIGGGGAALWAAVAALAAAVTARLASGVAFELFAGSAVVAAGAALGAGVALGAGIGAVQAAAVVAVVTVGFLLLVPSWAFHLAGLSLPVLPATAAGIQRDEAPLSRPQLWEAASSVDRLMAAFLAAAGLLAVGCAALTARGHGVAPLLAADLGLALLLRARSFARTPLRLLTRAAGVLAVAVTAWLRATASGSWQALAIAAAGLVLGIVLTAAAPRADRDRPPYAARAADVLEYLVVGALIPLALAVVGVFGWARGIG